MSVLQRLGLVAVSLALISGCASSQQKTRREQRERAMVTAKLYCEFMNGEEYPDIDVAVNLSMAQKCDSEKTFSITNYKTPSEIPGIMYCCSVNAKVASTKGDSAQSKTSEKQKPEPRSKIDSKSDPKPKAEVKPKVEVKPEPTPEVNKVESTDLEE